MQGISFEGLGFGVATSLPEAPAELQLFRIYLEPGAALPLDPADPSTGLGYIEAGSVTVNVSVPITVMRAAGAGTPFPMETEEIAVDTDFTMSVGDSAVIPGGTEGEIRNDGSEQVSILVANVAPSMGQMMEEEDAAEATASAPEVSRPPMLTVDTLDQPSPSPRLDAYSLRLVVNRKLYDRGTLVRHSPSLADLAEPATLRLHPQDFDRLGIVSGDDVRVTSARGHVTVPTRPDAAVPRGVAVLNANQAGGRANVLIEANTPVTDVRVERP
jgi:anaerobic selenocysteine-containing dehydrogenase